MKANKKSESFFYKPGNKPIIKKKHFVIKRISPFLLLTAFLVLLYCYEIIRKTATASRFILFLFIIANLILTDFVLWNYFEEKKRGIIWIIEGLISVLIIHFFA